MSQSSSNVIERATAYCERKRIRLEKQLGAGQDGIVFFTDQQTAIKVFRYSKQFEQELKIYERLADYNITKVMEFNVPILIEAHAEFLALELEIVKPPFILDFAAAYLDQRPPFSDEQMVEIEQDRMEMFGDDWPMVESIMATLRGIGVHLADVKPGNITFR